MRELALAAESLLAIAAARVAMRLAPSRAVRWGTSEPFSRGPRPPAVRDSEAHAEVVAAFGRVVAREPIASTCLHRSLALRAMLLRRGYPARLRLGLGHRPTLTGHAWVELHGQIVHDDPEMVRRYEPLVQS